MSKADEIYFGIVDSMYTILNKFNFKNREELREKIDYIKSDFIMNAESAFDEIEEDYASEKGLEWFDDE